MFEQAGVATRGQGDDLILEWERTLGVESVEVLDDLQRLRADGAGGIRG